MDVFYDFEFIEDGRTIEPISLGMIRDDGEELYLINRNVDLDRIAAHEWLMGNVVPHLPIARSTDGKLLWNTLHPDYENLCGYLAMRNHVENFLLEGEREIQLWGWYCAYDHVALAQLFGPMVKLPKGIPMWTNDLKQEVMRLGNPELPAQEVAVHNALAGARQIRAWAEYLREYQDQ